MTTPTEYRAFIDLLIVEIAESMGLPYEVVSYRMGQVDAMWGKSAFTENEIPEGMREDPDRTMAHASTEGVHRFED